MEVHGIELEVTKSLAATADPGLAQADTAKSE
jgi:hypothetical protein